MPPRDTREKASLFTFLQGYSIFGVPWLDVFSCVLFFCFFFLALTLAGATDQSDGFDGSLGTSL